MNMRLLLLLLVWLISEVCASIVTLGACHHPNNNDEGYRCAVNSTNCHHKETWVSPWEMSVLAVKTCTCASTHIGRCAGSESRCATEESACPVQGDQTGSFVNPTELDHHHHGHDGKCMCTGLQVHKFSTETGHFQKTLYGACVDAARDNFYCVIRSDMCQDDEIWFSPTQLEDAFDESCTSAFVRVGACVQQGGSNCAIDADSCTRAQYNSTFLKPGQAAKNGLLCFLSSASALHTAHVLHHEGKTRVARAERVHEEKEVAEARKSAMLSFLFLAVVMTALNVYLARKLYSVNKNTKRQFSQSTTTKHKPESVDDVISSEFSPDVRIAQAMLHAQPTTDVNNKNRNAMQE